MLKAPLRPNASRQRAAFTRFPHQPASPFHASPRHADLFPCPRAPTAYCPNRHCFSLTATAPRIPLSALPRQAGLSDQIFSIAHQKVIPAGKAFSPAGAKGLIRRQGRPGGSKGVIRRQGRPGRQGFSAGVLMTFLFDIGGRIFYNRLRMLWAAVFFAAPPLFQRKERSVL